ARREREGLSPPPSRQPARQRFDQLARARDRDRQDLRPLRLGVRMGGARRLVPRTGGLTDEQIVGTCAADPDASGFPARERLLLRLVDELHDTDEVSDTLWQELRAEWSDEQLIELVALVGLYHLISFLTNAFRIPSEPYAARFPVR